MVSISGHTALYGIIGDPVAHSLSPLFQNHFIQQTGIDAVYLPFHVQPSTLQQALQGLHAAHVRGINVTIPHKEAVLTWVQADEDTTTIGAANTLKRDSNGTWQATNTDWQGFARVLQGLQADVEQPCLMFGAGGTARAVIHALFKQGARTVYICNRNAERAKQWIAQAKPHYPSINMQYIPWQADAVAEVETQCRTIVNTTSIGLHDDDSFPFTLSETLSGQGTAIDAVYRPDGNTAFIRMAKKQGYTCADGLPMLIAQGIASFAFWHINDAKSDTLHLPDTQESLQWVEHQLSRQPLNLPGWEKQT